MQVSQGPHPAATVVLTRRGGSLREVLLLRRPVGSAFAPDCWVFPGGRLDKSDYELSPERFVAGPPASAWAARMALDSPREAGAYLVAAVREVWEETGILLATAPVRVTVAERTRHALLRGEIDFGTVLASADLRIDTERLRYIAHWITPHGLPRRFDTRFFLTELGPGAECFLHGNELVEHRWLTPEAALRDAETGEMTMLPPTIDTLRRLASRDI